MPKKTNFEVNGKQYYKLSVTVGHKEDGKPLRKYFYGSSKKDAEEKRDHYLRGFEKGHTVDYDHTAFGQLYKDWLFNVLKPTVAANSFTRYETTSRLYIEKSILENMPLTKVTSLDIQKLYNRLDEKKGANTVERIHLLIKGFLKYCVRERILTYNPADNVRIKKPKMDTTRKDILTEDDIKLLKNTFKDNADNFVFEFALYTGMRQGEILALQHDDIDLKEKTIRVNKSIKAVTIIDSDSNRHSELKLSAPKTQESNRILPLAPALVPPLQAHIRREKTKHLQLGVPFKGSSFLFSSQAATTPIRGDHLSERWKALQVSLGIKPIRFHGLRHTFCTLLAERGVPLKTASELMGHSNIGTTANIYTHVSKDEKIKAVESLFTPE